MNELLLIGMLVGNLTVTSYQSLKKDTDNSPFYTSIGERTNANGVAVSRDLICGACKKLHRRCAHPENPTKLHYKDLLFIEDVGYRVVNDVMADKTKKGDKVRLIRNQLDIWVPSRNAEKEFHKKFKSKKLKVLVMRKVNE